MFVIIYRRSFPSLLTEHSDEMLHLGITVGNLLLYYRVEAI